jgi:hypothetical protein
MRIREVSAVGLLGVILLLAGCVPAAPTPTPTGTASAPPAELVVPRAVLDLRCATVVPEAVLADLLAGSVELRSDLDADAGEYPWELQERQAGMQRCQWGELQSTAAGLAVLPDAAAAFEELSGLYEVDAQYIRIDELGDRSKHQCGYGYCNADILVGEFWLNLHAYRSDLMDELDVEPLFLAFARSAVDAVRDAASNEQRDAWTLPADAFRPSPGWCSEALLGDLGGALGIPSLFGPGTDGYGGLQFALWERSGIAQCNLAAEDGERAGYGSLTVLPGAAWAIPELIGSPSPSFGAYEAIDADEGVLVASDAAGTAVVAEIDGSLLFLSYDGFGRDELLGMLPGVIDVVRAHPAP